jgi:hypothetical protein
MIRLSKSPQSLLVKDFTLRRQSNGPTRTREELDAKVLLQLVQSFADRRLRDAEKTRSLTKALSLGHRDKVTKMP